jgi:fatty acid desaturase
MTLNTLFWLHVFLQSTPLGGLFANQQWALIHEGIHGHLAEWKCHVLASLFGVPFKQLRYYHLKHHRENRIVERIDEWPWYLYYPQLFGGLYILELLLNFKSWYGILTLLVQATLFYLWGWWYLAAIIVRAVLISFFDYVYHYGGTIDVKQGYNLDIGKWGSKYLLGFNLHGQHHLSPATPGRELTTEHYDGKYFTAALKQLNGIPRLRDHNP